MKINYHAVNFKLTPPLKSHVETRMEHASRVFHKIDSVNVFLKVEKNLCVAEIIVQADGTNIYFTEKDTDMYRCVDVMLGRFINQAHKVKERQKEHKSKAAEHHNHTVLTRNVRSKEDLSEDIPVFSNKPLSRLEAYLELRVSKGNLLIFKDVKDFSFNIMLMENGNCFLIRREEPLFKLFSKFVPRGLVQYTLEMRKEDLVVSSKQKYEVKQMSQEEAVQKLPKDDFCLYQDVRTGNLNVLFRYGKGKIGLVENLAIQ
jgi:ribosomal subunit interface protein